jgi:hypothetical protein
VCVDVSGWEGVHTDARITYPSAEITYTVRDLVVAIDGLHCIRLSEITNPSFSIDRETGETTEAFFRASRFRPLEKKKTDISIFTEILDRENAKPRDKVTA